MLIKVKKSAEVITGNGLIANAFLAYRNREDVLIFASGVSNSLEENVDEFLREKKLLEESRLKFNSLFVYFSTISIYDPDREKSAYVRHKCHMERIIQNSDLPYIIFRLPQIAGKSNNNRTLLNYYYTNIVQGKTFELWNSATRYLIDIDDVRDFVSFAIDNAQLSNVVVNISTVPCKTLDIIKYLEKIIKKKAKYTLVDKGKDYLIPEDYSGFSLMQAGVAIDEHYVERVLHKYYKPEL